MRMKSENCLYCHCAEGCVYIFDDKEPCPLIELEEDEGIPRINYLRWIPCSKRLPEKHGYYLVQTDGSHNSVIDIAEYGILFDKINSDPIWGWNKASRVIAWMPLPEPYRGEGEAE